MKNYSLQPVFDTMQCKINVILGEFSKAFIEQNNYQMLAKIAEIGETTTAFINDFSVVMHEDEEESNSIIDEPEIIEAEVVTKRVTNESERLPREVYSQMKTFIFNFIGKRGGRTSVQDLAHAFHEEFNSYFTEYHYTLVNATTPKWQHKLYDQVKTMRTKGVIAPKTPGQDYDYYILTPRALKSYNRAALKVEKQLTLPNIEITG